ncbi:EF-P 5-aminopentanol modification-associated protein YfmF [Paenibacillus terrigena]|uniref:EF-P 5-aminopentanol modification-associated protein YfmF n=1 Tax=Paenibacillus terrigena TaxID=369333 RepID=UPI0003A6FF72|nr:pitrilysin family protein [Paenibacillus terrigena]
MIMTSFEQGRVHQMRIHVLPTKRFKTFAISLYIGVPLEESSVTKVALTPFVMRRGTESYPETLQFREHLDDMYGAGFGFDVFKRGDYQIVQFRMDVINDAFVAAEDSLLQQSFAFLGEVLTKPALKQPEYRNRYIDAEKETLRKRLEAIVNDKIRYAAERCIEEMCKNEPYRLHPLGERKAIDGISSEGLLEHYEHWLQSASMDLYVVGDTSLDEVQRLVEQHFQLQRTNETTYHMTPSARVSRDVQTIVEKLDVGQGKLNMGLRTSITYSDDQYAAALMYNGILGGYPHSKLFVNVREKESLAYYASSRFDGHKGICTLQSGIEIENYEKAVDIIKKQLDSMQAGNISDLELSQTKAMISNHVRELGDSAFEMIGYDFNRQLSGKSRTAAELLKQVEQVTIEDIKRAAQTFQLDTIYYLRDRKGE